jgi:hypothetical protein
VPNPGQANNGLGINSFSGPMGQKEPAYGAIERLKNLTALAPPGTPAAVNAPKRSKRAAVRGKKMSAGQAPAPAVESPASAPMPAAPTYEQQLMEFWQEVAADPNASPLVRQYAQEVTSG